MNETTVKPMAIAKVKIPPILLIAFILSIPLAAQKVTIAKKITSKTPNNWVEDNSDKCYFFISWSFKPWEDTTFDTFEGCNIFREDQCGW